MNWSRNPSLVQCLDQMAGEFSWDQGAYSWSQQHSSLGVVGLLHGAHGTKNKEDPCPFINKGAIWVNNDKFSVKYLLFSTGYILNDSCKKELLCINKVLI